MAILNRYKYIIVSVLMIISMLSINIIKPKAELYDSINLINNGNFKNGITGWILSNGTFNVVNGNMLFTGNGTGSSPVIYKINIDTIEENDKYYYKFKVRITNTECTLIRVYVGGSGLSNKFLFVQNSPVKDLWYEFTGILTIPTGSYGSIDFTFRHYYEDSATANGKTLEINGDYGVMFINLTDTFGAGNEPSELDCDRIYNQYFEGLKRQDIKPHDSTENAHKSFIQMIISTMLVPIDMLKSYRIGNQISLFDIFIGMIILVILTKTILKIGGRTSNDIR